MAVPQYVSWGHVGTHAGIPTHYTRDTAADGTTIKQIATSGTAPGATGGSGGHLHDFPSHSHSIAGHTHTGFIAWAGDTAESTQQSGASGATPGDHTHSAGVGASPGALTAGAGDPGNYDTTTDDPPWLGTIIIASDGSASGIPSNALFYYYGSAPAGSSEYVNARNRFWKAPGTGADGGSTGGTGNSHIHTSASHTHAGVSHSHTVTSGAASGGSSGISGAGTNFSVASHTHSSSSSSDSTGTSGGDSTSSGTGDSTPPWFKVLVCQNTSGDVLNLFIGVIGLWGRSLASIPTGWVLCDGSNGTPNLSQGKYVRGSNGSSENGNTGGATTHTHSGTGHTHTSPGHSHTQAQPSSAPSATVTGSGDPEGNSASLASPAHVFPTSATSAGDATGLSSTDPGTSGANGSNDPAFTGYAYIQLQKLGASMLFAMD